MTVSELQELLEDLITDGYGDSEVRLAFQPSWPLQFSVRGVATTDDLRDFQDEPDEDDGELDEDVEPVVYLTEGDHPDDASPYAPRNVHEASHR